MSLNEIRQLHITLNKQVKQDAFIIGKVETEISAVVIKKDFVVGESIISEMDNPENKR